MANHFSGASEDYLARLTRVLGALDCHELDAALEMIDAAWQRGSQIITLGNGGSAVTALHYVTDWSKMVPLKTGRRLRARTLIDNIGLVTAYANDMSFANIFVEQLKNILEPDDLVVAISGSGNSENIIRAVSYANAAGAKTLGLCGFDGGRLRKHAHHSVWARVNDMQLCEDVHAIFGHIVMQMLCSGRKEDRGSQLIPVADLLREA